MTSALLPIFDPSQNRGSSGTGISYYSTAARCSKRAHLDKQAGEGDPGEAAKIGIVGHALLELFYKGDLPNGAAIQVADINYNEAAEEATRAVRDYLRSMPERDAWGDVVAVEATVPHDTAGAASIKAFLGVDLTARFDLVTRPNEEQAARIFDRTGLTLTPGKVHIIDHKFSDRKKSNAAQFYGLSAQFKAYPLLWNLLHPDDECAGMIANGIIHTKTVAFQQVLIPPPTGRDILGLRAWLRRCASAASTVEPNWAACLDFNRVCSHYLSGKCDRS